MGESTLPITRFLTLVPLRGSLYIAIRVPSKLKFFIENPQPSSRKSAFSAMYVVYFLPPKSILLVR